MRLCILIKKKIFNDNSRDKISRAGLFQGGHDIGTSKRHIKMIIEFNSEKDGQCTFLDNANHKREPLSIYTFF